MLSNVYKTTQEARPRGDDEPVDVATSWMGEIECGWLFHARDTLRWSGYDFTR
jgi:hypothetical protein